MGSRCLHVRQRLHSSARSYQDQLLRLIKEINQSGNPGLLHNVIYMVLLSSSFVGYRKKKQSSIMNCKADRYDPWQHSEHYY